MTRTATVPVAVRVTRDSANVTPWQLASCQCRGAAAARRRQPEPRTRTGRGPGTQSAVPVVTATPTMRFESHFKSYFGNVKAFNLKKIKIIAEPVTSHESPQWPEAACGWGAMAGEFLRQTKGRTGPSLERNPSNPFQKPLEVQ